MLIIYNDIIMLANFIIHILILPSPSEFSYVNCNPAPTMSII